MVKIIGDPGTHLEYAFFVSFVGAEHFVPKNKTFSEVFVFALFFVMQVMLSGADQNVLSQPAISAIDAAVVEHPENPSGQLEQDAFVYLHSENDLDRENYHEEISE